MNDLDCYSCSVTIQGAPHLLVLEVVSESSPFKLPLTPKDEYWAGYIHADGSISQGYLQFGQKQRKPVDELANFLTLPAARVKERLRSSTFGLQQIYVLVQTQIVKQLRLLGIKSEEISSNLLDSKHFWRGMIDGDGSLGWQKVRKERFPHLSLCGTEFDMIAFSVWCGKLLGANPKLTPHKSGIYYIQLGTSKAKLIALLLFDGEYTALDYKANIAQEFKSWVPNRVWSIK